MLLMQWCGGGWVLEEPASWRRRDSSFCRRAQLRSSNPSTQHQMSILYSISNRPKEQDFQPDPTFVLRKVMISKYWHSSSRRGPRRARAKMIGIRSFKSTQIHDSNYCESNGRCQYRMCVALCFWVCVCTLSALENLRKYPRSLAKQIAKLISRQPPAQQCIPLTPFSHAQECTGWLDSNRRKLLYCDI